MRVWTDGSTHLVLGPRGLTRYTNGKAEPISLGEAAPSRKGALAWHARGVLAVDAKAQTAWVEWNGKLREVRLGEGRATAPKALDWKPKDMVVGPDGTAVAVLDAGKGKGRIVAGAVPADGNWKKTLEVPEPKKVKWPAGVIWAKGVTPPWSKKGEPGHDAYLSANASGIALAERSTGIVARMPPGKTAFDFAVRVPTQDEADVTAAATPQGLLIVVCIEGRNSAAVHVDTKGKILATLAQVRTELEEELAWGFGPPALVGTDKAFLVHEDSIPLVLDLKLPALEVESTWELPATSEGEKSIAASDDGKACVLGFGGESWLLTRTTSGWQLDELGGEGAPGGAGAISAEDEAADLDIAAMLKAALGGGAGGGARTPERGTPAPAKPGKPAKEKKPAPASMHPEKALDEFEDEREAHVEKAARKKKKRGPGAEEPDLGFGDLDGELGREDEDVEELEEEGLQEREPGDEEEEAGEEAEDGVPAKPAAAVPGARRPSIEGEPALTLVAQAGAPKMWGAKPGTTLSIDLGFGNVGGASKGIFLEVEGSPIGAKKLVPRSVRVGGTSVAFAEPKGNKARIEIRDVALSAGAVNEKAGQPPVPSEVLTVTLELDAAQAVDDLLLVRLGPLRVLRPGAGAFTHGKRLLVAP